MFTAPRGSAANDRLGRRDSGPGRRGDRVHLSGNLGILARVELEGGPWRRRLAWVHVPRRRELPTDRARFHGVWYKYKKFEQNWLALLHHVGYVAAPTADRTHCSWPTAHRLHRRPAEQVLMAAVENLNRISDPVRWHRAATPRCCSSEVGFTSSGGC